MRLLCRLLGGHHWSEWQDLVFAGWTTNIDPKVRYCQVCVALDYNEAGQLMDQLASEGSDA